MSWKGKVYLVAGVGSGLGSAVASLLASSGATVVATARSPKVLSRLESHAHQRGWSIHPFQGDLSLSADVDRLRQVLQGEFGPLEGASLQTGRWVPGDTLLHKTTDEEWSRGISDNLDAIFHVSRAIIPLLLERKRGSVVLVSAANRVRWSGNVAYCVAKGGLVDLTRKLARDYRPYGIRFNAVLPGTMEHELPSLDPPEPSTPFPLKNASGSGAWEVARTIRFLLGDEARWITGATIPVDGGFSTFGPESLHGP